MKRAQRHPLVLATALALLLALSACGGEPAEQVPEGLPPLEAPEEEPELGLTFEDILSEPLPVTLEPVNESGVEGRATTIQRDDSVQVNLMVQGLPQEGEYAAHIHRGTCESGGGVVVTLNSVRADAEGMGRSTTMIAAGRVPETEPHFVQVHGTGGAVACGDVHTSG